MIGPAVDGCLEGKRKVGEKETLKLVERHLNKQTNNNNN
jgi:hypothetical protein